MICLYAPLDTKAVCILIKNTTSQWCSKDTDNDSIFYFQYPAPKNAYYPPAYITHRLGRLTLAQREQPSLFKQYFGRWALSLTRDVENLTKICKCCPLPCEQHLARSCVLSEISHSNKLVSRGHLANHGFIKTAQKSR